MFRLTIATMILALSSICTALDDAHATNTTNNTVNPPGFAVSNRFCSGTLVTSQILITSANCEYKNGMGKMHTGFTNIRSKEYMNGMVYDHPKYSSRENNNEKNLYDIAVMILNKPYNSPLAKPIKIPSYAEENALMTDKSNNLNLLLYTSLHLEHDRHRNLELSIHQDHYVNSLKSLSPNKDRPLTYIPISRYRTIEPERFINNNITGNELLFSASFFDHVYNKLYISDAALDDQLILTSGRSGDNDKGIISPVTKSGKILHSTDYQAYKVHKVDTGGTIATNDASGNPIFIGSIAGTTIHMRLKENWPWIIDTTAKHQHTIKDALYLARQVLGKKHDIQGVDQERIIEQGISTIHVLHNKESNELEYFRSIALNSNIDNLPGHKASNQYWQYLGTKFPTYTPTTIRLWMLNDNIGKKGDIYIHQNVNTHNVEYFRLIKLLQNNKNNFSYGYFPTNKISNEFWEYLGDDSTQLHENDFIKLLELDLL